MPAELYSSVMMMYSGPSWMYNGELEFSLRF